MANQEKDPPQQEQPFVTPKQLGFNLEYIILNTNNEVALLYPEHTNQDFFKCVSDFISKCCLREPFTGSPNIGIYGKLGVNTFRNAIGAHYLPHSKEYVAPPSIDIVRPWFETIGYGETCLGGKTGGFDEITNKDAIILYSLANGINIDYASIFWEDIIIKLNKNHREKVIPYTRFLSLLMMHKMKEGYRDSEVTPYPTQVFSVNNWALKPNQPEEPLFIDYMLAICNVAEPVVFKSPNPSCIAERVPKGTKPESKPGHKKHLTSLNQPSVSSKEATKGRSSKAPTGSKTGHLKRKKESS
ncbi:hypothetical protein Tco_0405327 [Tanacetum coccineum]